MLAAALAVIACVFAVIEFTSRGQVPDGALIVRMGDQTRYVNLGLLDRCDVQGTVKNGNGEETAIDASGVQLSDVLAAAKVNPQAVTSVTATSDDGRSAEITGDEVRETGRAFLYPDDNGAATLVVFGDADDTRNVPHIVSLDVTA